MTSRDFDLWAEASLTHDAAMARTLPTLPELQAGWILAGTVNDDDLTAWRALYDARIGRPAHPSHLDARIA